MRIIYEHSGFLPKASMYFNECVLPAGVDMLFEIMIEDIELIGLYENYN